MSQKDKTGPQEENFSLREKIRNFLLHSTRNPVECSNGSEALGDEHTFVK